MFPRALDEIQVYSFSCGIDTRTRLHGFVNSLQLLGNMVVEVHLQACIHNIGILLWYTSHVVLVLLRCGSRTTCSTCDAGIHAWRCCNGIGDRMLKLAIHVLPSLAVAAQQVRTL